WALPGPHLGVNLCAVKSIRPLQSSSLLLFVGLPRVKGLSKRHYTHHFEDIAASKPRCRRVRQAHGRKSVPANLTTPMPAIARYGFAEGETHATKLTDSCAHAGCCRGGAQRERSGHHLRARPRPRLAVLERHGPAGLWL